MTTAINHTIESNQKLTDFHLDLLNQYNLGWSVVQEPLITATGKTTSQLGLFRSDNGFHLGTHSERYNPCQNAELAKLLVYASSPIDELNITETKGGIFNGGKKVYFQIPLPQTEIGNAQVQRWLTALNSHDGSSAVALGTTQTVISCQNTFYRAYRATDMSRVGHYSTMQKKLEALTQQLFHTIEKDKEQTEVFCKMYETQVQNADIELLKKSIFSITDEGEISTRKTNLIKKFDTAVEVEFAEQGENLWGLFNAVTRYTNHGMKDFKNRDSKLAHVVTGMGSKINSVAYQQLANGLN